jgi:hypothetical protein
MALPTVGERSGTAGLFQDLTFLQVWPIEESDEYSDGELTRPVQSHIPFDLLEVA